MMARFLFSYAVALYLHLVGRCHQAFESYRCYEEARMDRLLSVGKVKKLPGFLGLAALRELLIAVIAIGLLGLLSCSVDPLEDPV